MNITFVNEKELQKNTNTNVAQLIFISQECFLKLPNKQQEQYKILGFTGKYKELLTLTSESNFLKTVLVGVGAEDKLQDKHILDLAGYAIGKVKHNNIFLTYDCNKITATLIGNIILGIQLKAWAFDKYISDSSRKNPLTDISIKVQLPNNINKNAIDLTGIEAVFQGVTLARGLINEPANILYPATYVKIIKDLQKHGIKVTILDAKQLNKLGMGALLSVAIGSNKEPYVAIMEYVGNKKQKQPLAFVGKGVTFDSGGYSLKPAMAMIDMKKDMSGSASVVGLLKTLALRKAKVNVIGVVGLVENMVNGESTKPGDIVTSMSGKTIERLNTDAEGRLVLADLLWYTQQKYNPKFMVNLATLTGAIIVSLGTERAGLFSNNQELIDDLLKAGEQSGELLWHMPTGEEYSTKLHSPIADLQDISLAPKVAGSIYAAMFLKEFVNDVPWAHLDIAGVAALSSNTDLCQHGASGFGVRLLNELVKKYEVN